MEHHRIIMPSGDMPIIRHALLVSGAAALQAGSRTAAIAERIERQGPGHSDDTSALVAVFAAGDIAAAPLLAGSFHPRVARATGYRAGAGMMKPGFTLAF